MGEFQSYRKKALAEMRPYEPGESLAGVTINPLDAEHGSPKAGDYIGRDPLNHADQWLVSAAFMTNYEPVPPMTAQAFQEHVGLVVAKAIAMQPDHD